MICRQIRFTLHSIDNNTFSFERRRRTQFHLSRETSATQTYNPRIGYFFHNFFSSQLTLPYKSFATVNAFLPFISFHINKDGRFRITARIDDSIYFGYFSADRRVNSCRNKTSGFGNLSAYLHNITFSHHRLCRGTDMLP